MKMNTIVLLGIMVLGISLVPISPNAHNEEETTDTSFIVNATKTDLSNYLVDGSETEWDPVPENGFTLRQLSNASNIHKGGFKIAYNETHLALLIHIEDNYSIGSSATLSPAIAVEWKIDDDAGPHMGLDGGVSTGKVDIWQMTIENEMAIVDDEWATSPTTRSEDDKENTVSGAWGYNNGTNEYIFEFVRPLTTDDANDTQFKDNATFYLNFAYWDPDQTDNGWVSSGHYITVTDYKWIQINFGTPPDADESADSDTPGFLFWATILTITSFALFRKKKF